MLSSSPFVEIAREKRDYRLIPLTYISTVHLVFFGLV